MFFVKGNFLLLNGPDLVASIDETRNGKINIVSFTSREEAEKFLSILIESLDMKILEKKEKNGVIYLTLESVTQMTRNIITCLHLANLPPERTIIRSVQIRYHIQMYGVAPALAEDWREAVDAAAKYIKNG